MVFVRFKVVSMYVFIIIIIIIIIINLYSVY